MLGGGRGVHMMSLLFRFTALLYRLNYLDYVNLIVLIGVDVSQSGSERCDAVSRVGL